MSFRSSYKDQQIKVWEEFYWDYEICLKILEPLKEVYKERISKDYNKEAILKSIARDSIDTTALLSTFIPQTENFNIEGLRSKLKTQIENELKKIDIFYTKCYQRVNDKFRAIKPQIEFAKVHNELDLYSDTFEVGIKELYKEVKLLKGYIELNMECKSKILAKFAKYSSYFQKDYHLQLGKEVDELYAKLNVAKSYDELQKLSDSIQELFQFYFAPKYKDKCSTKLKHYCDSHQFSNTHTFYLGLFIGLLLFQFFCIGLICFNYNLDIDTDSELSSVFPMFRAFGTICLYWWVIGFNVYVWNKGSISYKIMFQFSNHYSEVIAIYKRAAFFSFVLMSVILLYMLDRANINVFNGYFVPTNILPLICWGILFIYLFCPFHSIFNYKGRMFMFQMITESIFSFLMKPSFRDVWTMDQITSFVGPMRDMEYTLCYYAYYNAPLSQKQIHCRKSRGIFLVIAFFPNVIRMLQCIKMIIDSKNGFPQKYNVLKFCLNLFVATCSFFLNAHPILFYIWFGASFISTCFSYFWDLKMDFGLLDKKGFPLREKLFYKSKIYYYIIGFFNFFLRFLWLITLSPEVINSFIRPETLSIILYALEVFRRGMWNCIRLEYKHLEISKEFRVCEDIELPFELRGGKYYPNESNLTKQMNMSRDEFINYQTEKLFVDNSKLSTVSYIVKEVEDYTEKKQISNDDLRDYLDTYKQETEQNLGIGLGSTQGYRKASRKL
ncbi:MAG: hypothetical protein MJ252_24430 [archaeon]|nr:hypothetical protein [archaeon]